MASAILPTLDIYDVTPSSPPRQFRKPITLSSSPLIPSIADLIKKETPSIRNECKSATIPLHAMSSFTTASRLLETDIAQTLESLPKNYEEDTEGKKIPQPQVRKPAVKNAAAKGQPKVSKTSRKTTTKQDDEADGVEKKPLKPRVVKAKDVIGDIEGKEKPVRKPRAKKVETKLEDGGVMKEKPVRKPRAKKAAIVSMDGEALSKKPRARKNHEEGQLKLPKAQIKKASSISQAADEAGVCATTSRHFPVMAASTKTSGDAYVDVERADMEPAVKRRLTWTPPKTSSLAPFATNAVGINFSNDDSKFDASLLPEKQPTVFMDLSGSFGFKPTEVMTTGEKQQLDSSVIGAKKRKLIELVKSTSTSSTVVTPDKVKAVRKKPRTLTDLATSAYAPKEEPVPQSETLLHLLGGENEEAVAKDKPKVLAKSRSKATTRKSSKAAAHTPLLSPRNALNQVHRQDFVFGTSSQLAREQSPTLLRDLHTAMQASNAVDDPFASSPPARASSLVSKNAKVEGFRKPKLWSAASRDTDGDLMEIDMTDLSHSPPAPPIFSSASVHSSLSSLAKSPVKGSVWRDDDLTKNKHESVSAISTLKATGNLVDEPLSDSSKRIGPPEPVVPVPRRKTVNGVEPTAVHSKTPPKKATKATKKLEGNMPNFEAYTTAQLAKQVASYRFKAVKKREQMITLLEKCWEGQQRLALETLGTNKIISSQNQKTEDKTPPPNQSGVSPKKPRGRPRKESALLPPKAKSSKSKILNTVGGPDSDSDTPLSQLRTPKKSPTKANPTIEEISDSELSTECSPPRPPRSSQLRTPLPLLASDDATSPLLSPTSAQRQLFATITKAVMHDPPSADATHPSWHEKILLYDPILLEDLAAWLNTVGLGRVGWDGEVDPKEVKKWCESQSVCCLWRESLRNGTRSRY